MSLCPSHMCAHINKPKFLLTVLATFVFIFLFSWLYHGQLLMGVYEQHAHVWRPMEEMQNFMAFCLAQKILIALFSVWLFIGGYEGKGLGEGLRFGLVLGLLIGVLHFGGYIFLPISLDLALLWLLGGVLEGIGIGLIAALLYRAPAAPAAA